MKNRIAFEGFIYEYEKKPAENGDLCLATNDPQKYCNGVYSYSSKDNGDGLAFVITGKHKLVLNDQV